MQGKNGIKDGVKRLKTPLFWVKIHLCLVCGGMGMSSSQNSRIRMTQYITLTCTVSISPAEFGISERPVDEEVDKVAARLDRQHHAGLQQNPCVCIT